MQGRKTTIFPNKLSSRQQSRENRGIAWYKAVPEHWFVCSSHLFVFLLIISGCFWRIHLSKIRYESTVWLGILCSAAGYILPSPRRWTNYFCQIIAFLYHWVLRPRREDRVFYNLLKIGTCEPKFDKIYFLNTFKPLYDVTHREIENLEFLQCVNFEFIDSSKNNGRKHLLIFDIRMLS